MQIFTKDQAVNNGNPRFSLDFILPGLINQDYTVEDYAFGPISRIDHAHIKRGVLVPMHEHTNDEIISYLFKGQMFHEDSDGNSEKISPGRLMLMGAGKSFWHQESTTDEDVEMLQIFIRPRKKDLMPQVQFYPREVKQDGNWNQLAGPENSASPLTIRQAAYLFDAHFAKETNVTLPQIEGFEPWLYVMAGSLEVAGQKLTKGQAVTGTKEELAQLKADPETSLVLLMADLTAEMTYAGKFSGIKRFEYVTQK